MKSNSLELIVAAIALVFTVFFVLTVIPPLMQNWDVVAAFGAGFVNPYSSGFAADAIACWFVLGAWVAYERSALGIKHGWPCLLLGIVPGVAVGFAVYLIIRIRQTAHGTSGVG